MYMSDLVIEQITLEKANLIIKSAIDKAIHRCFTGQLLKVCGNLWIENIENGI